MSSPPQDNQTDFVIHPHIVMDRDGEVLQCLVKATFELDASAGLLELAPEARQRPVRFADIPWGEPEKSSIAYPSDTGVRKPGTDVIVVASAHPPKGAEVTQFDAYARVGQLRKVIRIFGLRVWQEQGSGMSAPRPATEVEVRYDNAWGGIDDTDPARYLEEPRNPVGKGLARDPARLSHQIAPSIEDPDFPILTASSRPPPAGLGAIGRSWEPRRKYVGTYDKAWKELRAPLPPSDEDDRINNCASPGLTANPPLRGNEACGFLNLIPGGGALEFTLPALGVEIEFRVKDRAPVVVRPHLDTVLFDLYGVGPDFPPTVELGWRAYVKAPRRIEHSLTIVRELKLNGR